MKIPIGVEINEQYLKFVMGKSPGAQPRVSDCIIEPITSSQDEQIIKVAADILRKYKLKPKYAVLSFSRNLVTVRNLHLPSVDKGEITQMIDLNIARIVPYKRDDIFFSYRTLGTDDMGYSKAILAIVKADVIRRQLQILEKAGLFVDKISLSSYGVWEWVYINNRPQINQTDLYLALDIDSTFSDFIIFSCNNLLFTRSINVGADALRDTPEIGPTKLLGELKQSLIMFYNEEINKKPAVVFLSGANVKDTLGSQIESDLGIPVKSVPNPYSKENLKSKDEDVLQRVSVTGVAELTARHNEGRIYFMLPELAIRKSLREKTKDLIILGSLFVYLLTMTCAVFLGRIYNQQNYLKRLEAGWGAIEKDLGDLMGQLGKMEFVKTYLIERRLPLLALSQLNRIVPQEISINSISMDEQDRISLRGQAIQLSDVFKFISTLEKQKYFKDVVSKYTRKKKVKDKDLTDFELSFLLGYK